MKKDQIFQELKGLVSLSIPVVLTQLGIMFMQIVDTFFIGRVGAEELAGVGAGSAAFFIVFVAGMGVLMALDPLISQAWGAKKTDEAGELLIQGLWMGFFVSIPAMIALFAIGEYYYLFGATEAITFHAKKYIQILVWSLPPTYLFLVFKSYWQSREVVMPVFWILVVANGINALANDLFVSGSFGFPQMGVVGVGMATLASRIFMLVLTFLFTLHVFKNGGHQKKNPWVWRMEPLVLKSILFIGLPVAGHLVFEVGGFAIATTLVAQMGAISMSAHHIALNLASMTFMVPAGIATAVSVRVGNWIGAKNPQMAVYSGWLAIFLGGGVMSASALVFLVFPEFLFGLFTVDSLVVETGKKILLFAALFQIFDGVQVSVAGALRGAGFTRSPMIVNLMGHYPIGLLLAVLTGFYWNWGVQGIWLGLASGLAFVAIVLTIVWWNVARRAKELFVRIPVEVELG